MIKPESNTHLVTKGGESKQASPPQAEEKRSEERFLTSSELLRQLEVEKKAVRNEIMANVEKRIIPILSRLRKYGGEHEQKYLDLLERNLTELTSSFGYRIGKIASELTPKEMEICNMIKNEMNSKEISRLHNVSPLTTHTHRNRIRKKLGLSGKKIKLIHYLKEL